MDCFNYIEHTRSTQDEAKELLKELGGEMVAVYTFRQTQGRGMAGNVWFGGENNNVALSLGIKPDFVESRAMFVLNMALSLGALEYVRRYVKDARLKWPNDLYSGEKKLGGVLIETAVSGDKIEAFYFGIGWNVNQPDFPEDILNPVSLRQIDGVERNLEEEARYMADALNNAYSEFKKIYLEHGLEWTFYFYRAAYLHHLFAREQWRNYTYKGNEIRARIKDVDINGHIYLETSQFEKIAADVKELKFDLRG